jgi:hypothetical protein
MVYIPSENARFGTKSFEFCEAKYGYVCNFIIYGGQATIFDEFLKMSHKKGKIIPVTSCEGLQGCEMSRLPHFLDNPLTDGSKTISLTHRPPFTPG